MGSRLFQDPAPQGILSRAAITAWRSDPETSSIPLFPEFFSCPSRIA
jgi:hypothetical protein